ncbi:MAG: hypothetical protein JWO31_2808 [Phycisphaerales bacterium]|nr:hypothetical protein [Phycisphaerales bacterium]
MMPGMRDFKLASLAVAPPGIRPKVDEIKDDEIRKVAARYIESVEMVVGVAQFPIMAFRAGDNTRQCEDQAMLKVVNELLPERSLTVTEIAEVKEQFDKLLPPLVKSIARSPAASEMLSQVGANNLTNFVNRYIHPSMRLGIEGWLCSILVNGWTVFESLAGNLWEKAINVHPVCLSELSGKYPNRITALAKDRKKEDKQEQKQKQQKKDDAKDSSVAGEGKTILLSDIHKQTRGCYDLSACMGTLLRKSVSFTTLDGIREAYSRAFSEHSEKVDRALAAREIDMLKALRNLIVHKSGHADDEYHRERKGLNQLPLLAPDEKLVVDGEDVYRFVYPVLKRCSELIHAVDGWIATHRQLESQKKERDGKDDDAD